MKAAFIRMVLALSLVALGWTLGRAQERARTGDFVIAIEGEVGTTSLQCVRGCTLQGERDLPLQAKAPVPTYTFSCGGTFARSCRAVVHGFLPR